MNLPKGSGLELLGKVLQTGYKRYTSTVGRNKKCTCNFKSPFKIYSGNKPASRTSPATNPVQTLIKGVTSAVSQLTKRPETVDYNTVVKGFMPSGVKLLKPQYPYRSGNIQFADLDGDARDELIASYYYNNAVNTVILKKQNGHWYKAAEINNPEHENINYRTAADIAGEGKKQLLLGLTVKDGNNRLYGYSLEENTARKLFSREYYWVETAKLTAGRDINARTHLAFWDRDEYGTYNIDVRTWDGLQLEAAGNTGHYFYNRVVPYYMRKLRANPNLVHGWYSLAEALKKAGASRDALRITELGMRQIDDPLLKEKFGMLKKEISG